MGCTYRVFRVLFFDNQFLFCYNEPTGNAGTFFGLDRSSKILIT